MRKAKALRLKPGKRIVFSDSSSSKHIGNFTPFWEGEVIFVTPNGGIRVRAWDDNSKPTDSIRWVPYHHVYY